MNPIGQFEYNIKMIDLSGFKSKESFKMNVENH
jgi:hypothetical protein